MKNPPLSQAQPGGPTESEGISSLAFFLRTLRVIVSAATRAAASDTNDRDTNDRTDSARWSGGQGVRYGKTPVVSPEASSLLL